MDKIVVCEAAASRCSEQLEHGRQVGRWKFVRRCHGASVPHGARGGGKNWPAVPGQLKIQYTQIVEFPSYLELAYSGRLRMLTENDTQRQKEKQQNKR